MYFLISLAMTFLVIFQFRCVTASSVLGLKEIVSENNENVLVEFFAKFHKEVVDSRSYQIMCIGDSNNQLSLFKPLMEQNTYYLAKNVTEGVKTIYLDSYSADFVFIFLTSMDKSYVHSVLEEIYDFNRIKFCFIYENSASNDEIDMVLNTTAKSGNIYTMNFPRIFIQHHKGKVKLYAKEFSKKCLPELVLLMNFSSNSTFEKVRKFYWSVWDHKGCSGIILTRHTPPSMVLEEKSDDTLKIVGGSEGLMALEVIKYLNASPNVSLIRLANNITEKKIITIVAANWKEMLVTVDRIRYRYHEGSRTNTMTFTAPYSQQCAVWAVPIIPKWNYAIFIGEFSIESWIVIGVTFVIFIAITSYIRSRSHPQIGKSEKAMLFCGTVMDMYSMSLGNSLPEQSMSGRLKEFMLILLWYSLIITTLYKGSLSSIITAGSGRSAITDTEGILKANLSMGGDIPNFELIQDIAKGSDIFRRIVSRFVVYNDTMAAIRRVAFDKDFAFVIAKNELYYIMEIYRKTKDVPLLFDIIDDCVLTFHTGAIASKNTRILTAVDDAVLRLTETGLVGYWQIKDLPRTDNMEIKFENPADSEYETTKAYQLLVICIIPIIASIFVFFGELIHHKLTPHETY